MFQEVCCLWYQIRVAVFKIMRKPIGMIAFLNPPKCSLSASGFNQSIKMRKSLSSLTEHWGISVA